MSRFVDNITIPRSSSDLEERCLNMLVDSKNDRNLYRKEEELDVRWSEHPSTDAASLDIILDSSDADSRSTNDYDPPSPPPECSNADGEWVWMTNEGAISTSASA